MKTILTTLLIAVSFSLYAQGIKISDMPTLTNPQGAYIPAIKSGVNYKVPADNFGLSKMDTAYNRNDSIFGKKNGTEFFIQKASSSGGGSFGLTTLKDTVTLTGSQLDVIIPHHQSGSPTILSANVNDPLGASFSATADNTNITLHYLTGIPGSHAFIYTIILAYTNARARSSISLTTTGTSGPATYNSTTGAFNIPNYSVGGGGSSPAGNYGNIQINRNGVFAGTDSVKFDFEQLSVIGHITGKTIYSYNADYTQSFSTNPGNMQFQFDAPGNSARVDAQNITGVKNISFPNVTGNLAEGITDGTTTIHAGTNGMLNTSTFKLNQLNIYALNTAPSSATDTGTTGEIRVTSAYVYVCIATNTWVRAALTTW